MVSLTFILISAAIAVIFYFFLKGDKNERKLKGQLLPPGPKGVPILGSLLSVGRLPYIKFGQWVSHYGDIMTVKLFNIKLVVISDQKLGREAYGNPALVGKPDIEIFTAFSGGNYGILATQGNQWVEQRRFALRQLRDFGFGKSTMEDLVMGEVIEFIDLLKKDEGKSISLNRRFTLAVINSLSMIMSGRRYKQTDEKLNNLLNAMNQAFADSTENPMALFAPQFVKLFPNLTGWNRMMKSVDQFHAFIRNGVEENKAEFRPEVETPLNFTDSYLHAVHNSTDPNSTFYKELGDKNLMATVGDLFGAGSETTSQTLNWAILYLTTWPETQVKLHEEIDRVVGQSRRVNLEDRKNLVFVQAVIAETLRKSSLTPLGVFHSAMEDTQIGKYIIPKGTMIAINQHYIHHDPIVWGDPERFRPERFLSSDGKTVLKNDHLLPFSVGKRVCVGENLARDEIFLFLTNILQKFTIHQDPNKPTASLQATSTIFLVPPVFHVIMKDRTV